MTARERIKQAIAWVLQLRLVRAALTYSEHRGAMLADAITYRSLFGIFASVLLGFSLVALWFEGNAEAMTALGEMLDNLLPGITSVIDITQIEAPTGLTILGIASLLGIAWAAISAIASLRTALLDLGDTLRDDQGAVWGSLRDLLFAVGFAVLLVSATVLSAFSGAGIETLASWLGLSTVSTPVAVMTQLAGIAVVFIVDLFTVALMFRLLADFTASSAALWQGALLGAAGLTVLQTLSSLFVKGATSNPLLASFAVLIALLLWVNLSVQVVLIASSYIMVATRDHAGRGESGGALVHTFAERRQFRAEQLVAAAERELNAAQGAVAAEREHAEPGYSRKS
ncbi:MAG: YihY/virulence factor BrkB family protein [Microbacteriaceae bacterium]